MTDPDNDETNMKCPLCDLPECSHLKNYEEHERLNNPVASNTGKEADEPTALESLEAARGYIVDLQKVIASLERRIATDQGFYNDQLDKALDDRDKWLEKAISLESSLEGMKKRNEELEKIHNHLFDFHKCNCDF